MFRLTKIRAIEASGPGALPGFSTRCSCGLEMKSSSRTQLMLDAAAHSAYHARKEAVESRDQLLASAAARIAR